MTKEQIEELLASISPTPWRSLRDGNQYINTKYLPTAKCVGASKVEGLARPWNPHAYVAFGFTPAEFETARFLDTDADFIAAAPEIIRALLDEQQRAMAVLNPSMPESGIEDACRQLMQAYITERDNAETADRLLARAREEAFNDAINEVRSVVKGWCADVNESWDERPDLSFEAADKVEGANQIITALEAVRDNKEK